MRKTRILIADDEPFVLKVLARLLAGPDTELVAVADGPAVLAAVRERIPDLIVLDIDMPGVDGLTVCRTLRGDTRTSAVPVLVLSGSDAMNELRALDLGADRYLGKPFEPRLLSAHVRSLLQRSLFYKEANPLTGLPGNGRIEGEVQRRLSDQSAFWFYYVDVRNFKAYNDAYGFARGDELLKCLAAVLADRFPGDFVGHVGGDDFVLISRDPVDLGALRDDFALETRRFYGDRDIANGWFEATDRDGARRRLPLVSLTVGETHCDAGTGSDFRDLCATAARRKESAKQLDSLMEERTHA